LTSILGLPLLEEHWKVTVVSALSCVLLQSIIGPILSSLYFPTTYPQLPPKTRFGWNIRVVAFVHALIVTPFSYYYLRNPPPAYVEEPLIGYDRTASNLFALSFGYFLWDTVISVVDAVKYKAGWGFVLHGVACAFVFSNTFRPFATGFGAVFLLWELSTIFLNPHWFFDKLGMTGSRAQLINGILLLSSFFFVRLVIGTYHSYRLWVETFLELSRPEEDGGRRIGWFVAVPICRLGLNFFWFRQMIAALKKRF
ncbi:DUF887-domain-containing protein, partial [Atractiella rhizophila]